MEAKSNVRGEEEDATRWFVGIGEKEGDVTTRGGEEEWGHKIEDEYGGAMTMKP